MQKHAEKIIVGMSGGVDSSVAALLLNKQGYQVEGLFMKNWEQDDQDNFCAAQQDAEDAHAVCQRLQIPLHTVNFAEQYWNDVFEHFLHEYQAGRTPNPDVLCNKEIKFRAFLEYACNELNASMIATGHYASKANDTNEQKLLRSVDADKDQTYFLYALDQHQLKNTLFPLGQLKKAEVRKIAKQHGFANHAKKDSTGICFIGERKFKTFLQEYLPPKPGDIKTLAGEIIGRHDGLMYYTIGQRQGLNIGGMKAHSEQAWYVAAKDITENVLVVVQGSEHPALFKSTLICEQTHWIAGEPPNLPLTCTAKIRYRQIDNACTIIATNTHKVEVKFVVPQRAITPGQAIVFYDEQQCLGGATIVG